MLYFSSESLKVEINRRQYKYYWNVGKHENEHKSFNRVWLSIKRFNIILKTLYLKKGCCDILSRVTNYKGYVLTEIAGFYRTYFSIALLNA